MQVLCRQRDASKQRRLGVEDRLGFVIERL
jgi:hypothetical protein